METMRANPKIREWWAMTDGMQVRWAQNEPPEHRNKLTKNDWSQESPIPGAVGSADGPGWWKVLDEVFYTE